MKPVDNRRKRHHFVSRPLSPRTFVPVRQWIQRPVGKGEKEIGTNDFTELKRTAVSVSNSLCDRWSFEIARLLVFDNTEITRVHCIITDGEESITVKFSTRVVPLRYRLLESKLIHAIERYYLP